MSRRLTVEVLSGEEGLVERGRVHVGKRARQTRCVISWSQSRRDLRDKGYVLVVKIPSSEAEVESSNGRTRRVLRRIRRGQFRLVAGLSA